MTDKRNVDNILDEWAGPVDEGTLLTEAIHPNQAIQTIQTALRSLTDRISSVRVWLQDYGKKGGGQ